MVEWLIWIGAAVSLVGLAGVGWSVQAVLRARRADLPDADLRARLQGAVVRNVAALAVSTFGLVMVIVGVILA